MDRRALATAVVVALLMAVGVAPVCAQAISLQELVRETQKQGNDPGRITIAWWLPEEFWTVSAQQGGGAGSAQAEAMTATLRPYLVIAAVDGKVGPMGGVDYLGAPALRATVKVKDAAGRVHAPLSDAELSADLRNLAAVLRTLFGSMLGAMGEGIEVFFFPANSADAPIAVASKEGAFSVTVGTQTFQWRLPLAALMPQKVCPEDGEKMSGAWKYCPWHGKALAENKPGDDDSR